MSTAYQPQGIDPIDAKREGREKARAAQGDATLFREAAESFIAAHGSTWKSEKHKAQWRTTLETYAYPRIGTRPVAAIDDALINELLIPVFAKTPETAARTKQRILRVCKWVRDGSPLPHKRSVKHHAALAFAEIPAFMAELRQRDETNARALEFIILTAARTAEAIGAKWEEIDFEAGVWTVPADRMKPGKPHLVPLSERALSILAALPRLDGGFVFAGSKAGTSIHKTMPLQLLHTMRDGLTVHGFRSSFSDWCGERTEFDHETREFALSHVIPDKAKAAYRRYRSLEKRRKLMEAWSAYCASTPPAGKVIPLHDAA